MEHEKLEEIAAETFHKNIQYFAQHHRAVYKKLLAFDEGIEQGLHSERYKLLMVDDYFDIQELSSGTYLYDSSSKEYATLAAKSVNYRRDANVFETFKNLPIEAETGHFIDIAPTLKYIKENSSKSETMKSIKKFIFFGVGLGLHLVEIDKKIDADVYLIIEDDIELFKLSLFTTPFYELGESSELLFSVFDSNSEFDVVANRFLNTKFYHNHYLKYFQTLNDNEEKLKEFHIRVISQSQHIFFYKDILTQYLKPLEYMKSDSKFLNMLVSYEGSSFTKKPVILLAAGPSLQANIEWLKENQEKFIVVALSSVLNILERENIKPDIVTHMDAFEVAGEHFRKLNSLTFLDDALFLFSSRIDNWMVDNLKKENIFFYENGTSYKQNVGNLSAACVGSTTYLILLALGVSELYLLGLDLALNAKTGSTHSSEHLFNEKLDLESVKSHDDVLEFGSTVVKTAGNFQKEVFTKPEYLLSIESINSSSMGFKKESQTVYNLNNGALFLNTISTKIEAINTKEFENLNKKELSKELNKVFTKECSSSTTEEEIRAIKEQIAHARKLQEFVKAQVTYRFESRGEFLGSTVMLFNRLTNATTPEAYDISLILQEYTKLVYTFIFDFFNRDNITNESIEQINRTLSEAFYRMLEEYIFGLESVSV